MKENVEGEPGACGWYVCCVKGVGRGTPPTVPRSSVVDTLNLNPKTSEPLGLSVGQGVLPFTGALPFLRPGRGVSVRCRPCPWL